MPLRLLHYSDIENAYDDPERIGCLASLLRKRTETTLVCGTGDTIAPGVLSMETNGTHVQHFFEAVGPDFATFGNHEFDNGISPLRDIVNASPQTWLTTNLLNATGDQPFLADDGVRRMAITSVDGKRIGLFGVSAPRSVRAHPGAQTVTVQDAIPAAERAVANLRTRGVDRIVVLSHLGKTDDELAQAVDVDIILGGHTHDIRADRIDETMVARRARDSARRSNPQYWNT